MLFDHVDLRVGDLGTTRGLYDALLPENNIWTPGEDRPEAFFGLVLEPGHRSNCWRR